MIRKANSIVSTDRKAEEADKEELDYKLGNLFQGKVCNNSAKVNLNAKKLDFDFDNDDFFN